MDLGLQDKVVLVTGGGQGVGRTIAESFVAEGARVAFHYNTSGAGADEAATGAVAGGAQAIAVGADINDDGAVGAMVASVTESLGPIDILINNAGFTARQRFMESTPEDWAPQIDVTITGTMRVTQAVLRSMTENGGGSIVNLMGDSGRVGESGLVVTATARAATVGFTKSLAKEVARFGVRVNCVSLGLVKTPSFLHHSGIGDDPEMLERIISNYPLRRLGEQTDVPPMVMLLASPSSDWVTGQIVSLNGGYAMP